MQIGVLGSGVTAQTIGSKLIQLGHEVMLGSREEANANSVAWARDLGGQHALYGTFMNAAAFGEIIFNCTLGSASLSALEQAGAEALKGYTRIIDKLMSTGTQVSPDMLQADAFPDWGPEVKDVSDNLDLWRRAIPPEHTSAEADFLIQNLKCEPGARVLDVPCGNGRLTFDAVRVPRAALLEPGGDRPGLEGQRQRRSGAGRRHGRCRAGPGRRSARVRRDVPAPARTGTRRSTSS